MSKNKTLETLKKSLQDASRFIQDRDKEELNEGQKKELKDAIEKVFEQALLEKGESRHIFKKIIKDKDEFLRIFNPWQKDEGIKLIEKFVDNINNSDSKIDFSWLDILDEDIDKRWEKYEDEKFKKEIKENKKKYTNMRYQIPTHFHGDIDNAVLFYCMENPRGYIEDSDMDTWAEKQMHGKQTIDDYYKYTAKLRDETWKNETSQKIIKERYNLNDFTPNSIKKIIYSNSKDETPLSRELENMFFKENKEFFEEEYILKKNKNSKKPVLSEKYYYIAQYYAQLLDINGGNLSKYNIESEYKEQAQAERDKAFKISEKICNVEIYPFSSSEPNLDKKGIGDTILRYSDLSRLGVYIILRRIYKYLEDLNEAKKPEKPVIIFRKYDSAWKKILSEVKEDKGNDFNTDDFLEKLEETFFYCQLSTQGGGITSGNVISVHDYKVLKDKYEMLKELAFTEILDLITKGDTEKEQKD